MGSELPILEYAPVERVGGEDRYRLWFLLAGVPALIGMCVPIGGNLPSFLDLMLPALREIFRGGFSSRWLLGLAIVTASLAPLSAMVWRVLRLREGKPGQLGGIIGLTFSGILIAGFLGLLCGITFISGWDVRIVAMAAGVGVVLVVCGGFIWGSRRRLDLAVCVLLLLASVEMVFWALIGLILLTALSINVLGLVFLATAVVRGLEFAHVLRSRWTVEERV